ncbi:helix-turn-helix domain-containing protein, partial [Actinoplanes sp. RD1]|uniref:helix-turn-helix domain-containing protein n=1 Tax=Actinoplanes sp. RD1 TaxID=3064538 RepID=UPI0027427A76
GERHGHGLVVGTATPETLRKIESGRVATPAFPTIAAIAAVLGLSLDEIWSEISTIPEISRLAS